MEKKVNEIIGQSNEITGKERKAAESKGRESVMIINYTQGRSKDHWPKSRTHRIRVQVVADP